MHISVNNRFLKLGFVAALVIGVIAAGLLNGRGLTLAQEMAPQTYLVQAGAYNIGNAELLAFSPGNLQVHRGDTVTWWINGFHNVSFHEEPIQLLIFPEGAAPQVNPAIALPTIENGGTFTGEAANSGLPLGPDAGPFFSLVIDAEPGVYTYQCDIHGGMIGTIEVVADDVAIPTPAEVAVKASEEIGGQFMQAMGPMMEQAASAATTSTDGTVTVQAGSSGTGRVTVNQFFSPLVTIAAGETVTWVNPEGSVEPHFVKSVPFDAAAYPDFVPVMQEGQPPIIEAGPGLLGTTQSGETIGAGGVINSPILVPGDTFAITFSDPGVYPYLCQIHPGMNGVVVVQ